MSRSPTLSNSDISEPHPVTPPDYADVMEQAGTFKSKKPESLRIDTLGILPHEMVGKRLIRVTRSATHPVVTLYFADETSYQVRIDGYNPGHPGLPKAIETDPELEPILNELENNSDMPESKVDQMQSGNKYTVRLPSSSRRREGGIACGLHWPSSTQWVDASSEVLMMFIFNVLNGHLRSRRRKRGGTGGGIDRATELLVWVSSYPNPLPP
ncbi:unnamed protein product [Somion occarium]|uniref:Uncharacterized protein n=1 Tax=Somion occarium TaxID=3059160 RepID=A0ABP1DKP5_9APHY